MSRYHSELDIPVLPEAYLSCFLVARKPPLAARFYIVYIELAARKPPPGCQIQYTDAKLS